MDRLMIEYLRKKGMGMDEHEFMDKFKDFIKYRRNSMGHEEGFREERRHENPDRFMDMCSRSGDKDMYDAIRYMRHSMNEGHFDEQEAKYLVSGMYHVENGRKYTGEKFDLHRAKEICERYRGILPTSVAPADVYVAINSQYHDYAELFKDWFGNDIEQKVIESAIVFWFKDADNKADNKVMEYFKEY